MRATEPMQPAFERERRDVGARAAIDGRAAFRLAAVVGEGEIGERAADERNAPEAPAEPASAGTGAGTATAAAIAAALTCLWAGSAANREIDGLAAHAAPPRGSLPVTRAPGGPMFGPAHDPGASVGDTAMNVQNSMRAAAVAAGMMAATAHAGDAVQWRVEDGGNGHWYRIEFQPTYVCWNTSRDIASAQGGHLVTLTSAAENAFVVNNVVRPENPGTGEWGPYIGATGQGLPPGMWRWITDEPWTFSGFEQGEPNSNGTEIHVHYRHWQYGLYWNDSFSCGMTRCYVVEWSADCNDNGIVDFEEIRQGMLTDLNSNNVPDCCESTEICCPSDLNEDGEVNGTDLGALIAFWGPNPSYPRADLDRNGYVNGSDIAVLLGSWGQCTP
jgi:hypothetical protein